MKLNKPGMRNIKTGIGVMLCILVGYFNIIDKTFFAAVACIVCMQTTVKSSLTVGLNRLKGTFIGGVVGFLFVLIRPGNPILACLGIITTIYICNILKVNSSITIACVVFCAIMINIGSESPLEYSVHRIIDTSIGVIIGVCVNYFICRPNYLKRIYNEMGAALLEKECKTLAEKNDISDPEDFERLKHSTKLLAEWMGKGMEIYASIQATPETKATFPPIETQSLPDKAISLLTDGSTPTNE